tara:strand:- start:505 stop:765 length:261 start_codon:yes stop_codon:yes gene_type:complete
MTRKYVTTQNDNGMDYRSIAELMSSEGDKMNHSTVRNIVTRGFMKVVSGISSDYDLNYDKKSIKKIAQSPEFQDSLIQIMKGYQNE